MRERGREGGEGEQRGWENDLWILLIVLVRHCDEDKRRGDDNESRRGKLTKSIERPPQFLKSDVDNTTP